MHFNGRFIVHLAQFAEQLGADAQAILALTDTPVETLSKEDCRMGPEAYNAVVLKCIESTGDKVFGLHAGEHMNLSAAGLIVQIAQTSSTVEEALNYCCEFANLGCSALPTKLQPGEEQYRLTLTPNPVWARQSEAAVIHTVLGYLAFMVREFQALIQTQACPVEIWMACSPIDEEQELRRVLGCDVLFDQKEYAIIFRRDDVEQPVVTSDYHLLEVLVRHAEQKLNRMQSQEGFFELVRRSVVKLVKPEFPTIEQVAGHLNMSVRTFQRKLSSEGRSYKQLVDELRREFALDYLSDDGLSVSEIAYLLSYSDASAFIRTFKRWMGETPATWRKTQLT